MDPQWAEQKLLEWIAAAQEYERLLYFRGSSAQAKARGAGEQVHQDHYNVLRIVKTVLGSDAPQSLMEVNNVGDANPSAGIRAAQAAVGALRRGKEYDDQLGSQAPRMVADQLHPTIWQHASALWSDGHHGMAVQRAATHLSATVQDRVNRYDVNDSTLMQQVFSPDTPKPGKKRLRWPGDPTNQTVKAMNEGIRNFSLGCFQAIRNPVTHTVDDIPEQEALEKLAALSVLARWIETCEVEEA